MPHGIILGVSGCGKTTLAKKIAKSVPRVAVCEYGGKAKIGKTDWGKPAYHTLDINSLLWFAQNNINCNIFIDDAGDNLARARDYDFFTTCGRRWGHTIFLITQRANQITPNVRSNCETLYCFRQSQQDIDLLMADFPIEFQKCASLKKGEFLVQKTRFDKVLEYKLF
jgi:ABC-type dipeptide/oligopeptide/nickel transport system ATPase component